MCFRNQHFDFLFGVGILKLEYDINLDKNRLLTSQSFPIISGGKEIKDYSDWNNVHNGIKILKKCDESLILLDEGKMID